MQKNLLSIGFWNPTVGNFESCKNTSQNNIFEIVQANLL